MNQPNPSNRFDGLQTSGTVTPNSVSSNKLTPRSVSPVSIQQTQDSKLLDTFDDALNEIKGRISAGTPGIDFVSTLETYEQYLRFTSTLNIEALKKSTLKPIKLELLRVLAADQEKSSKEASAPQEPALPDPSTVLPAQVAPEPSVPTEDPSFTMVNKKNKKRQEAMSQKIESMAALDAFPTPSGIKEVDVDYKDVYGTKPEVKPGYNPISKQSGLSVSKSTSPLIKNPLVNNRKKPDKSSSSVSSTKDEKQDDSDGVDSIEFPRLPTKTTPAPAQPVLAVPQPTPAASTTTLERAPTPVPMPTPTPAAGPVKPEPSTTPAPPAATPGQPETLVSSAQTSISAAGPAKPEPTPELTLALPEALTPASGETPSVSVPVPTPHVPAPVSTPSTFAAPAAAPPAKPAPTTTHNKPKIQKQSVPATIIDEPGSTPVLPSKEPTAPAALPPKQPPKSKQKQPQKQPSVPVAPPAAKEPPPAKKQQPAKQPPELPVKPPPVPKVEKKPPTVTSADPPKSAPTNPTMKSLDEGMTDKKSNTSKIKGEAKASVAASLQQFQVDEKKRHIAALQARLER